MATVLDGPVGSELEARGVPLPPFPWWSAWALEHRPHEVARLHADYAAAGATVHTTATFRTRRRNVGDAWERLALRAVRLARGAIGPGDRLAGGVAPLESCYRPDLSPPDGREEHRELARLLAAGGVDLLLCESFANVGEALVAVEECVATGLETWVSFCPGPAADLLTVDEVGAGAEQALERGAAVVLVNCLPARHVLPYVERLTLLGAPCGAYPNAGDAHGNGWDPAAAQDPAFLATAAASWLDAGATIVGGCCGTRPHHVAELARAVRTPAEKAS